MIPPPTRRVTPRSYLVYVYHPIVTKLVVSFLALGLLLLIVSRPEGQAALLGMQAALHYRFLPSLLLLAALFAVSTLSPFFPEFLVTVAAGFIFGVVPGGLFAIVAITLAASGNFFIARRFGRRVIHRLFDLHSLREIRWTATRISRLMVFLTWLLPSINFDLISYASGLSRMPYPTFLTLTISGNILSSLLLAFLGEALRTSGSLVVVVTLILYTAIGTLLYLRELPERPGAADPPERLRDADRG